MHNKVDALVGYPRMASMVGLLISSKDLVRYVPTVKSVVGVVGAVTENVNVMLCAGKSGIPVLTSSFTLTTVYGVKSEAKALVSVDESDIEITTQEIT